MRENHIRILCSVLKVEMVCEAPNGELIPFFETISESPLMQSEALRKLLREGTAAQHAPFLHRSDFDCWFAGLRAEDGFLYMGPMCHQRLSTSRRRQMYRAYGIENGSALPKVFTLPEIRNMVLLTNSMLENASLENEELLQLNRIINEDAGHVRQEQAHFVLREEEQNDDSSYRHGYGEERLLMEAIREGRAKEAVSLAESMDADSGRLSEDYLRHRRNLALIGIALCARAAIEGGISPETAYRVSGYYILKCDAAQDPAYMLHYRNRAIEELAGRVAEIQSRSVGSAHVARARDYIRKHYREAIRLEDMAGALGISPSYLSRLYHRETGMCLQDAITEVRVQRAAELLLYSRLSLSEIAVYVHFPNQSYFTKVFKKRMGTTPLAYRSQNTTPEITRKDPPPVPQLDSDLPSAVRFVVDPT